MASDPRLTFLKSYEKYTYHCESISDDVFVTATPVDDNRFFFVDPQDAKFNLSSHVGLDVTEIKTETETGARTEVVRQLVWGGSDFDKKLKKDTNIQIEGIDVWTSKQKLRHLRVRLKNPTTEDSQSLLLEPDLDERLGIFEYFDPISQEIRLRFGLQPNISQTEQPNGSQRSIILCFDGTSNHFSGRNTNVVKLVELLKKNDPLQQMVYYQTGVGTYSHPGLLTGLGSIVAAKADEGVAWFLYQHIIDGYKYLMETYHAGDRISIFGFSRGAYTARALAGMLHSVFDAEQVPFAYKIYAASNENKSEPKEEDYKSRSGSAPNGRIVGAVDVKPPVNESILYNWYRKLTFDTSNRPENVNPDHFKMVFSTPVQVEFLGVWDTVGSVGTFTKQTLPWIEYNPSVKCFRQALALDETRGNFIPSLWDHSQTKVPEQNSLEVWFKGGHTDVGGGAPQSLTTGRYGQPDRAPELSNIPLRWMMRQCLKCTDARILFDPYSMCRYRAAEILEKRPLKAEWNDPRVQDNIRRLDNFDISPEPYKAIKYRPLWWILEILPVPKLAQRDSQRIWPKLTVWCPNLWTARAVNPRIVTSSIKLHYSVFAHLQYDLYTKYKPIAVWHGWSLNRWPQIDETENATMMINDTNSERARSRLKMIWKPKGKPDDWLLNLALGLVRKTSLFAGHVFLFRVIYMAIANAKSLPSWVPGPFIRLLETLLRRAKTLGNISFHFLPL